MPTSVPQGITTHSPDPTRRSEEATFPIVPGYVVLAKLAEGGMGQVLKAFDPTLEREVAVKIIRPDKMPSEADLARFVVEAKIGGLLQHPYILPVYQLGTLANGRPFLAMKLVQGRTLANLLNERPNPRQDVPRFLKFFEQVCQALGHAHRRGILHRDLKPHNVMVGEFGEVQVMDWGLAKQLRPAPGPLSGAPPASDLPTAVEDARATTDFRLGATPRTQAGDVMGTPAFLPPEQARGEVDRLGPPTDVFSLGAILCQVLTGRPPYRGPTPLEMLEQAQANDLGEAYARLEACEADAELIALAKACLAAEPEARPADGGAVAQAVSGYLASLEARLHAAEVAAAEARARATAERQRRRSALMAAGVLLVGLTGLAFLAWYADGQRQRAEHEEANARTSARDASQQAQFATEVNTFLREDLLGLTSVKAQMDGGMPGNPDLKARELLDRAARKLADGERFRHQPLVEAAIRVTLGEAYLDVGQPKLALEHLERGVALYRAERGAEHLETLRALSRLASGYYDVGQFAKALQLWEAIEPQITRLAGADHPETLIARNNRALGYKEVGQLSLALPLMVETLRRQRVQLGDDHRDTLNSMNNLAAAYRAAGRLAEAVKLHEEAARRTQAKLGEDHPETLVAMLNLAAGYSDVSRKAEALTLNKATLRRCQDKLGPDHTLTLMCMVIFADLDRNLGLLPEAFALLEVALPKLRAQLGVDHPLTLHAMNTLAGTHAKAGQAAQALPLYEETFRLRRQRLGSAHPDTLTSMSNLALWYWTAGRLDEAIPLYQETFRLRQLQLGPDHRDTLTSMAGLGRTLRDAGRWAEGLPYLQAAYAKCRTYPTHRWVSYALLNAYLDAGQTTKALPLIRELVALARVEEPPGSPNLAAAMTILGGLLERLEAYAEAEPVLREGLALREPLAAAVPPTVAPWQVANVRSLLGGALLGQEKYAEAEPLLVQGWEGLWAQEAKIPPAGRANLPAALVRLVRLYEATGKAKEAAKYRQELRRRLAAEVTRDLAWPLLWGWPRF